MARERAVVLKELQQSESRISHLTRRLDSEKVRFGALSAELQAAASASIPVAQTAERKRRTPEANMIDSVSRIVHRCRAAKITAEQAERVAILQIATLAREKYALAELPQIVRDRVRYEVAQSWGDREAIHAPLASHQASRPRIE
jgi:hypothetical protein